MSFIRISKQFTFEMAHALSDYDGLCRNLHGHSYYLDVTVRGKPNQDTTSPKWGMLIDFGDLKRIVQEAVIDCFDHALVLNNRVPDHLRATLQQHYEKVVFVSYQPTTENLLIDLAGRLLSRLPARVQLFSLKLRETDRSYAEWYMDDNQEI
ncbi:MAG: 6-carboxytetrahydropterin synthase [Bacteroidales bacterium]|jgi:6-pyruvoyltetrahydropterin/6-carboxytetrahydropterin synthase|nr:6-carboxytetrahydropterin synthase [Bacteroidales bacterium]